MSHRDLSKCRVCRKRQGVEEHGGHLCSLKCELEYSQDEAHETYYLCRRGNKPFSKVSL